jgi:drug/metabolite transporter (DMT)-like permease
MILKNLQNYFAKPGFMKWVFFALIAHIGFGANPVLSRYLQTVSHLPGLSILASGTFIIALVISGRILPRMNREMLRSKTLWLFAGIVILRAVTNVYAVRFAPAIYAQMIYQMTPFVVALLATTIFKESLPRFTGRTILLAMVGALMMLSPELSKISSQSLGADATWLGIGLAMLSTVTLAIYMLLLKRTAGSSLPGDVMWMVHTLAIGFGSLLLSFLLGEDWSQWLSIGVSDWIVFAVMVLGIYGLASLAQIIAIRGLGAPMVSNMLSWRLIVVLILSGLMLDEKLGSIWQVFGAILVMGTISWYLWQQTRASTRTPG